MNDEKPPILYGPNGEPIFRDPGRPSTNALADRPEDDLHHPAAHDMSRWDEDDRPGAADAPRPPPPPHVKPEIPNHPYLRPPTEGDTFQLPQPGEYLLLIAGGWHGHPIPVAVDDTNLKRRRLRVRYVGPHRIDMKAFDIGTDLLWGRVVWTIKGRAKISLNLELRGIVPPDDVPAPPEETE